MKIKLSLSAIALALLPCLPAKAEFFTATITRKGWIQVDTDSIQKLNNGNTRFISREVRNLQIQSMDIELIDCWNFRGMFLAQYNFPAQMWVQESNPKWYTINPKSPTMGLAMFVCSLPGN
jgi:hypothetical protein